MIRVLIVDDDKLARKGLISIMPWESHGMTVVGEAANGAKALEFLAENQVDLVFTDLAMPVMSGLELIGKAGRMYPKLRFVALTFHEDFEIVQKAFRLGVLDYISKLRLEKDNYEEIFDRIQSGMSGNFTVPPVRDKPEKAEKAPQKRAVSDETEKTWREIEKNWKSLYWIYDESAFEELCARTLESELPLRKLERFFLQATAQVERITHISIEIWLDIEDCRSAIEWIQGYRRSLYEEVGNSAELSMTSVCILKTILYIRENLVQPLHAEELSSRVGMSRSYFCQCFKKLAGLTINDYIRQERIRLAKVLLSQSQQNDSIMKIAQAVGYSDVKYFSHIFHQQTGVLPSEYRINRASQTVV